MSKEGSQRRLSRSTSDRRLSTQTKINVLEKLQRSLSQGRILPYDNAEESEPVTGKLIEEEKSEEGTVTIESDY